MADLLDNSLEKHNPQASPYFYFEFLQPFLPYLVVEDKPLFTINQRSGSCSLMSLIARVIYEHNNMPDYYQTRLELGLVLIRWWKSRSFGEEETLQRAQLSNRYLMGLKYVVAAMARDALEMFLPGGEMSFYPTRAFVQRVLKSGLPKEKVLLA